MAQVRSLRKFLNELHAEYHQVKYLSSDPLEFAHSYPDPWDQEAVALLSAVLAYGNVKQIRKSVENALSRMKPLCPRGPAQFVRSLQNPQGFKKAQKSFESFVHRFNVGEDLILLFWLLGKSWNTYGSLGGHFLQNLKEGDQDIGPALSGLISEWYQWLGSLKSTQILVTFSYLLTSPSDGSCCKRWCMFLRWMGRKDSLDLGLWGAESPLQFTFPRDHFLQPHQLVMPLDTHTGRISQYLGLTERKSLNWKAALEITQALKAVDPDDPTRYDFALSRLGILDICQRSYREEICVQCQLLPACRFAKTSSYTLSSSMQLSV